jgi:hypothetical protein
VSAKRIIGNEIGKQRKGDSPNKRDVNAHIPVVARAVQADVYTECHAGPCWVSGVAVKAGLQEKRDENNIRMIRMLPCGKVESVPSHSHLRSMDTSTNVE